MTDEEWEVQRAQIKARMRQQELEHPIETAILKFLCVPVLAWERLVKKIPDRFWVVYCLGWMTYWTWFYGDCP